MGLNGVLHNALAGLEVSQAGLDVVSRNVANSSTVGYSKQRLNQSVTDYGGAAYGVKVGEVQRVMDQQLVRQLRGEVTGAGYTDTMQSFLERLEISFGAPGASNGLESLYGTFEASLESLISSPENPATRAEFVQSARLMASGLNSLSSDVQALRGEAERGLSDSVTRINQLLEGIANTNSKIALAPVDDPVVLDQRDEMIKELSGLMDINVMQPAQDGTVSVLTRSGTLLVSDVPMKLTFEGGQSTVRAQSNYADGGLGSIVLSGPGRPPVDLVKEDAFRSGKIGALLELRDEVLVEAQNSLDALADSMAKAMSGYDIESEPVTDGRSIDLSKLQYGDDFTFSYDDGTGTIVSQTFVATDGPPGTLPPGVTGIDFSGTDADIETALQTALGALGFNVSTSGTRTFDIVDDGLPGTPATGSGLSARATATELTGQLAIPLFTDGNKPYVGNYDGGAQQLGFAGRIQVNTGLLTDSTALSNYMGDGSTPLGDPARPRDMLDRLQSVSVRLPNGGINAGGEMQNADLGTFVSRIISAQAMRANAANQAQEAQGQVVAQLEERAALKSNVSVDEEMTRLIQLQTAYQANARVVTTFQQVLAQLMDM